MYELTSSDKSSNAEALWSLKVASADYSLRSCDNLPQLWRKMFAYSPTAAAVTFGRSKASYIFSDGLGPFFARELCNEVKNSDSCFTILFDETTTAQGKKQMDILLRFWSDSKNEVITMYLTSFIFARTSAQHITELLMSINDDFDLPWERFFNLSSDGPNINLATWRILNEELKKSSHAGLLPLIVCTLHTMHTAFQKGISIYGEDCEQLAFDLNQWFKISPCKQEDFRNLSDDVKIEEEALFLHHVDSRWLTLAPALERILKRWEDAKDYFLRYLPDKKEYKKTLPNNKRYTRIKNALNSESETLLQIKFLVGVAPIFTTYLKMFQAEGPLVHLMFVEMKSLLVKVMKRFLKAAVVDGKKDTELKTLNVTDKENQLILKDMDVGTEVVAQMKKIGKEDDILKQLQLMQLSYVKITQYLQKKLPIDNKLLQDLRCLHPYLRDKPWTVNSIARIAEHMPHIIKSIQVSQVKDEWKSLQAEVLPDECDRKRIDKYYANIFNMKNMMGEPKFKLLRLVIKSALSLQNGNASVERSLSDNKNTLTKTRTNLSAETLVGLRRAKQYAANEGGVHNVIVSKGMRTAVREAHQKHEARLREEEEEKTIKTRREKEKSDELRKQKEQLEELEKSKGKLETKETELQKDEVETDRMQSVAENLLKEGNERLATAISQKDFASVEVAYTLIEGAKKKLEVANSHRQAQKGLQKEIGLKRKSLVSALMSKKKKKSE